MNSESKPFTEILSKNPSRGFSKYLLGIGITTVCFTFLFGSWSMVWAQKYQHRVAPNVTVASENLRGKSEAEVRVWLQQKIDDLMTRGVTVQLNGTAQTLPLATLIGSDFVDHVSFDIDKTTSLIMQANHDQNPIKDTAQVLFGLFRATHVPAQVTIQTDELTQTLHTLFPSFEQPASDTTFLFSRAGTSWDVSEQTGVAGNQIDTTAFLLALTQTISNLQSNTVVLHLISKEPTITKNQAELEIPEVKQILKSAPFVLQYHDETGAETSWPISTDTLTQLLIPTATGHVSINETRFNTFLEPITKQINEPAKDARFKIINGRVSEFIQSEDGKTIQNQEIYSAILNAIHSTSPSAIEIATHIEKPTITTRNVNDLGVTEILGQGRSSFKGSPGNRKKNIQNGMNLLNGLLIPPGETFSLLHALEPFTIENGYLPELVIKGDKITPDLGGGLCQIGTTTFRTAMNSGLPINERQNHSLVVQYYNDPSNNNPGTDATIFEPAPDFKFTNNTGHYILFETAILKSTQQLEFTFWGTADGRKGSYTPPTVSEWIPFGADQISETTDLKPGEEKCQEAHKGANTSFTYTIKNADGTKTQKVYTSHYRPLPKICVIGIDPTNIKGITTPDILPPTTIKPLTTIIPN